MVRYATTDDIDQMIATLPRNEEVLVKRLRFLIGEYLPQAEEKAYYGLGIPFYRRNRLICFIWPPSVFWEPMGKKDYGKKTKNEKHRAKGVSLGFCQGNLMSNEDGLLLAEGRKQVYVIYFRKLDDVDENQVRSLLFEAAMIDEQFDKKKKRK
jgi:hypothetical protein